MRRLRRVVFNNVRAISLIPCPNVQPEGALSRSTNQFYTLQQFGPIALLSEDFPQTFCLVGCFPR